MRNTTTITVRGTRFHKAGELLRKGSLSEGMAVRLEHQPDNPHDKNAVAIRVRKTGAMLGYVSKELAPKYAALAGSGKIIEASIAKITKDGEKIDVRVAYEQSGDHLAERNSTRLWQSASAMPAKAGIYAIRNVDSGRQYIGSSNDLRERLQSHFRDLTLGRHANHALQSDFSRLGPNYFEAQALVSGVLPSQLAKLEADRISSLLNSGSALYNLTATGQGTRHNVIGKSQSEPISDRLARERADHERRRINAALAEKRQRIHNDFDPKLSALLPQTGFWSYFIATFLAALTVLSIVIQNAAAFFLSTTVALVAASLINEHFREKARQTSQYQALAKQRDSQLAALEK